MRDDLKQHDVINWCTACKKLYPIKTTGNLCFKLHLISTSCMGNKTSAYKFYQRHWYPTFLSLSLIIPQLKQADFQKKWRTLNIYFYILTCIQWAKAYCCHCYREGGVPVRFLWQQRAGYLYEGGQAISERWRLAPAPISAQKWWTIQSDSHEGSHKT